MIKKALIVGINHYQHGGSLFGCVKDADEVNRVLATNGDGSPNFDVKPLRGTGPRDMVTKANLRQSIRDLFAGDSDIALFYFAGHGHIQETGGYILASDSPSGDDGLPLAEILTLAHSSQARNKIIILDSCHSGVAGNSTHVGAVAELKEGTTILTASTAEQYSMEENGAGIFTTLLVDALTGSAADIRGEITPGSIYAHIDQSLGPWEQRPVFKTHVKRFVSLRRVTPPIPLAELQLITEFFPTAGQQYRLDPTFEPERSTADAPLPPPDPANTKKFQILQKFNRHGLVEPVDAPHMWHAAMESKACRLTLLGEHYRRLRVNKRF